MKTADGMEIQLRGRYFVLTQMGPIEVECGSVRKTKAEFHSLDWEYGEDEKGFYSSGLQWNYNKSTIAERVWGDLNNLIDNEVQLLYNEIDALKDRIKEWNGKRKPVLPMTDLGSGLISHFRD